jgi:hypothetical protein
MVSGRSLATGARRSFRSDNRRGLNRGISPSAAAGGKEGVKIEARYVFATPEHYDIGRLNYIGVGYIPTGDLVGGNGASFHPGPFANSYLTRELPIPTLIYLGNTSRA